MAKIRPLSPELAEAAKKELFEEPGRLEADLKHLKDWIAKQPHLTARTDDQFLVSFLRGCKFSLERAKEKIDAYYTLRSALPEFYHKRDPTLPEMRKIMDLAMYLPLGVDTEGRRVFLMRNAAYDPNKVPIEQIVKFNTMISDIMTLDDDALIVKGQVVVMDMKGMTMAHATHMSPSMVKKMMTLFQDGYPLRPKGMHYLNMNPIFNSIFNLFKSFMKEKLQNRIHIHQDMDSLCKTIPKEILPTEYGGNGGSIKEIADAFAKRIESWKDFFVDDQQYGVDESKRPGKPKTHEDLFGMEGSFRPLTVD